jgi:transposase
MFKIKQIIQHYTEGHGSKAISKMTHTSRNTVKDYIQRFKTFGVPWNEIQNMDNQTLFNIFTKRLEESTQIQDPKYTMLQSLLPEIVKALRKKGMTIFEQWSRYKLNHPQGYQSSQFSFYLRSYLKTKETSMHIDHKAGDKIYVDFCGDKLKIVDLLTGELIPVEVFVAILGCSQLTFVCAVRSQKTEDFIWGCKKAFEYFEGVTRAIVPDNLKAAVIKTNKYEPQLNPLFETFCEHYGTVVIPARVYKPKDKALVEGAVKLTYQKIYVGLRDQIFHSLEELNIAILELLELYNNAPLNKEESRRVRFEQEERSEMIPLPELPYEIREMKICTVYTNGHIKLSVDKNFYSVPYEYVGKKVKVLYNSSVVEIFHQYTMLANHPRSYRRNAFTTTMDHLASTHQFIGGRTEEYYLTKGLSISPEVGAYLKVVFDNHDHPEQSFLICQGILNLSPGVDSIRLSNACKRGMEYGVYNYHTIVNILKKGLDNYSLEDETLSEKTKTPKHKNIRGKAYYN